MLDELSPEDSLRLQVLLAQPLRAVRLDEATLTLHALTDQGEASIPLCPNCKPDKYLRLVRERLSGHALGSPGGYPVHLSRWTRHGQMEGLNLGKLLLTGEPEAVLAVVHSPALTDTLAQAAWWVQPSIDNARLMLRREAVARGAMGRVLAEFLVEHLPFLHEDHLAIMDTVAVLIDSQALGAEQLQATWNKGARSNTHYVAFLERLAGRLPVERAPHPLHAAACAAAADGALCRALSAQGQTFLGAAAEVLERPETQEVVCRTLNAIGRHLGHLPAPMPPGPELAAAAAAAQRLGTCSDAAVAAIFARSTAIGSLMRRKIEPCISPVLADIRSLLPDAGARRRPLRQGANQA